MIVVVLLLSRYSFPALYPAKFGTTVQIDGAGWGKWIKFGGGGELRSIGNGNLHYTRGRIYIYTRCCCCCFATRDLFSLILFFCFFLFVISPSISHSHWFRAVTRWSSCIVMGNSVDSGQRVFAMKTARKSSFCSGVTKNKKKGR